jgi:hypothetical protein
MLTYEESFTHHFLSAVYRSSKVPHVGHKACVKPLLFFFFLACRVIRCVRRRQRLEQGAWQRILHLRLQTPLAAALEVFPMP